MSPLSRASGAVDQNNQVDNNASNPKGLAPDCGHNTWSGNSEDGKATGFPDCTKAD